MSPETPDARPAGPLAGVRVVDLTEYLAGPFCTLILASLGADVVKVERPTGDSYRNRRPAGFAEPVQFHMAHRNKRGIAVDVKTPDGAEVVRRLAASADVFVQNFRPGVVDRLGLGWTELAAVNPRLIYCSISGFGETGPYAGLGGFDLVAQAMAGIMSVTGPEGGAPVRAGYPIGDVGAGMWAAIGVLGAHIRRGDSGPGDHVQISMFDSMMSWSILTMSEYLMTGAVPQPMGTAHRGLAPYECFTASDGRPVAICAGDDLLFGRLCAAAGVPSLPDDPRFAESWTRYENRAALRDELAPVIASRTSDAWFEILRAAGVPVGPILSMADLADSEQVRAAQMLVDVEGFAGRTRVLGTPVKLASGDIPPVRRGPGLGEHTTEVLAELGYDRVEVDRLVDSGAVHVAAGHA